VECANAGDADAFGELYMLHLDTIYRYVYFRVGNADDAEDLTEQVFLKAWQALPGYEQRGYPFTSWLYRIAHNVVADHYRKAAGRPRGPSMDLAPFKDWAEDAGQPAALDQVIQAEETEALAAAIVQLSDEQQQVIILRFIEGMSHAEVSDILGKSKGACRVIQHRALATLSRLLKEHRSPSRPVKRGRGRVSKSGRALEQDPLEVHRV
jgi:RNA polymerase sigma-70 factor (ECF subfamily)